MAIIAPGWRAVEPVFTGRLGWIETPGDAAIAALVRRAGAALGALEDVPLPSFDAAIHAGMVVIGHETWQACGHLTATGQVGLDVHQRLLRSSQVTAQELADAEAVRARFSAEVDAALEGRDALVLPAIGYPVPSLLEAADASAALPITNTCRPFNLSGHPAIALPAGEVDGRPVSLQLVGRKGQDEALCALARRFDLYRKGDA
jgi:amidase